LGYFSLGKEVYNDYLKKKSAIYINSLDNLADKIWADVLHLQAVANRKDMEEFIIISERLFKNTNTNSYKDALEKLPLNDY